MSELLLTRPLPKELTVQPQEPPRPQQHEQLQNPERPTEQSLETLKIMLAVSFGSIAALRGLLPSECFVEEAIELDGERALTYNGFKDATKKTQSETGTVVHKIVRGVSKEADQLLDVLERGVFEALSNKYLQAVQLNIFLDPQHPDELVESYLFAVQYVQGGPQLSISERSSTTTDDAPIKGMTSLMKSLRVTTEALKPLPEIKNINIRLFYTPGAPPAYNPQHFYRVQTPRPKFYVTPGDALYAMQKIGRSSLGAHMLAVEVAAVDHECKHVGHRRRRPRKREYQNLDFVSFPACKAPAQEEIPEDIMQEPSDQEILYSQPAMPSQQEIPDTYQTNATLSARNDSIGDRIHVGLQERWEDGEFGSRETQSQHDIVPVKFGLKIKLNDIKDDMRDTPSRETPDILAHRVQSAIAAAQEIREPSAIATTEDGEDIISCECGDNNEDRGDSFVCDTCGEWKHNFCYGYAKPEAMLPRMTCFTCSLHSQIDVPLHDGTGIRDLCIARRIIEFILFEQNGPWTVAKLTKDLKTFPEGKIREVLKPLEKNGIIVPIRQSKTSKKAKQYHPIDENNKVFRPDSGFPYFDTNALSLN